MSRQAETAAPATLLVDIDDHACRDASRVGAKAARLALARAAGLPVPASVAIPCDVSAGVLAAAAADVDRRGVHACRLDVMDADRSGLVGLVPLASQIGSSLAVRSSSPLEGDPQLAGAYSSLIGVRPEEVPTAVLAVWASAIRGSGCAPRMGVLIQPELAPSWAGTAERVASGAVEVVAAKGSAQALTAGWATGTSATVLPTGGIEPEPVADEDAAPVLRAAAALATGVWSALGDDRIEWAFAGERIWLLQAGRAHRAVPRSPRPEPAGGSRFALAPPDPKVAPADRWTARADPDIALRAARWSGDLAERWILPWAVACNARPFDDEPVRPRRLQDPVAVWDSITWMSAQLTSVTWGVRTAAAGQIAARMASLRRGGDSSLHGDLSALTSPDPETVRRCLQLCGYLAGHLLASGVMHSAGQFWSLPADLRPVLNGTRPIAGSYRRCLQAALRWEPLLYSAVSAHGKQYAAMGVAPGMGCGRGVLASQAALAARESGGLAARSVVVARYPLPRYAPLLVGAAGLVAHGGSEAAHLVTVARSLGVPTVLGCELAPMLGPGSNVYIAIDGEAGVVSALAAE